jgi:hypothetical protein
LVNSEITFENEEQVKDYYPTLKQYKERDYALSACPFYFKDIKNEVCVVATTLSEVAWSQPILIV